jgi:hypothetical protein
MSLPSDIAGHVRAAISLAKDNAPDDVNARARVLVATLAGKLYELDPSLGAEVFAVLVAPAKVSIGGAQ